MKQDRPRRREPCSHDSCGSRRFHIGNDGFTYCDQGHQQSELGATVTVETGEFIQHGRTHRRQDSDIESGASRGSGLNGPPAFEHYLLCLQLVLRKQLHWFVQTQGLPQEFEQLVRDLWSLRLRRMHGRLPLSHKSDSETETHSAQMFSSQSESESRTETETATAQQGQTALRRRRGIPALIDLLSLDHIGMLLLRIPITVRDIHRMISSGNLLYYRAGREIPSAMKDRLPGTYKELLEPQDIITPEALHGATFESFFLLHADFDMAIPPLNHQLILYRWIRDLTLPLEVYTAAQRLAREYDIDFCYSANAAKRTQATLRHPEVILMVLIVIATKLLFPFDGEKRYPISSSDISALEMDWSAWVAVQSEEAEQDDGKTSPEPLSFQEAFTMSEANSLELAGSRLDDYLDWCESNVASDEIRETGKARVDAEFRRTLFGMFPVSGEQRHTQENPREAGHPHDPSAEKLARVQDALRPKRIVPATEAEWVPRSGGSYRRYRDAGELSWPADVFHQKAAEVAGSSLHGLTRAVFSMEKRLQAVHLDQHQRDRRRSQT